MLPEQERAEQEEEEKVMHADLFRSSNAPLEPPVRLQFGSVIMEAAPGEESASSVAEQENDRGMVRP